MLNFPRWKVIMIVFVCLYGITTALPNFLPENSRNSLPGYLPSQTLSLGLDLRGGVNLLFAAQTDDVITARLDNLAGQIRDISRDENRNSGLPREQRATFRDIKIDGVSVSATLRNPDQTERGRQLLLPLSQTTVGATNPVLGGGVQEVTLERDGPTFTLTLTEQGIVVQQRDAISRAMEVIRRRVDPDGTKEITLQPQGNDRIILEVPGASDPQEIKDGVGRTARLSFHDVVQGLSQEDIARGRVGAGAEAVPFRDGGAIVIKSRAIVSGDDLTDAKPSYDQNGQPVVQFTFNLTGAKRFGSHTANNVGRPFAIKLDDTVISAPTINGPILGGSGIITGVGNIEEVNQLAVQLKSGALPVELTVLTERLIGPGVGADNIEAGSLAAIVGFVAVIFYMIASYGRFGLAANVALITNLILITGTLSLFQATLTLPGIAGIVLTIGMAVDANVLIFERIREEQRTGAKPFQAMERGYGQAFSTIMDANITTFIAAAILYFLGTGPVQGFAVTLAIGILTSMFTAVVLTRFILASWLKRARWATLPI
ncbi:MAG: protein translocase subunit SecD [Kordiimonadaceae bacterium]|nr:protein translocase subunit SecD [Kordiimonadaceae bacterium]MBO6570609.1 protein translocase subunit SecD [Kordiimonadaceae bacterium]MBO6966533.1 protein translocase subunit SecD [Kordiimonadaceae bacterium]